MADTSKTVHQALVVLASLHRTGPDTAAGLARRLGLSRTVALRLLSTLEAHDFVRRTAAGYDLGLGLLEFSAEIEPGLRAVARPLLAGLVERFAETAVLALRDRSDAVAIEQVVPENRVIRIHYRPGSRHSLLQAAHGRAMLAHVPPSELENLVGTGPDPGRVGSELLQIEHVGFAVSRDELESGVSGVAAAVLDRNGYALASIGVVAPSNRMPEIELLGPAVREAAAAISAELSSRERRSLTTTKVADLV